MKTAILLLCALLTSSIAQGTERIKIVTLGDSITKGVRKGVSEQQTFASRLEQSLRNEGLTVDVTNVGIGGERTDQALKRLDRVISLQPDIVTVMYGTNDSYVDQGKASSRITLEAYRRNLAKIVTELLRRGILPVLMTAPRWSDKAPFNGLNEHPNVRLEPYLESCRAVAREWRTPLVDHFAKWTAARKAGRDLHDWTTDGCHPNPAGHQVLADALLPVLRQAIGPPLETRKKLQSGRDVRVVCFGDSVTGVYYHTGSRRAYTDMLGIALNEVADGEVEMVNAGISGNTTVNGLQRLERDVLRRKPDLVTVMFGLNDMTRVPLTAYRDNLRQIVSSCQAAGAEVILATPNNVITTASRPTEKLLEYCDVVRELGRTLKVPVADCYRELDAVRAHDRQEWRLLMSDAIHPNMDGHRRIAVQLAQSISRQRISLDEAPVYAPALQQTRRLLREKKKLRVLAMPPFDVHVKSAIQRISPSADVEVATWPVAGQSLATLEQQAKVRVRKMRPDLVLLAVPRSAKAENDDAFIHAYAWIMNWSLNFGAPTWDCVVVHPAVTHAANQTPRDELVRRLVRAQDLSLIDRDPGDTSTTADIVSDWFFRHAK